MNVDLDIDNYELDDILRLFKLDYDFDNNDLKKAKLMALKTHPDKSNLKKEYFIFFSKAYNILLKIYKFRNKKLENAKNKEYVKEEMNESEKKDLMNKLNKFNNAKDFNNWFNKIFEKVKVKNGEMDGGYGNWLNSDEDIVKDKAKNVSEFGEIFEKRKRMCKSIIKYDGVEEMYNSNGCDLTNSRPDLYQSDIFSKLKYEDVKNAHTVTVVPVTQDDINWAEKNRSLENYKKTRENIDKPCSLEQSRKYLHNRRTRENEINTTRAYNLFKKDEEIQESNNKFWSYLKQLKN